MARDPAAASPPTRSVLASGDEAGARLQGLGLRGGGGARPLPRFSGMTEEGVFTGAGVGVPTRLGRGQTLPVDHGPGTGVQAHTGTAAPGPRPRQERRPLHTLLRP